MEEGAGGAWHGAGFRQRVRQLGRQVGFGRLNAEPGGMGRGGGGGGGEGDVQWPRWWVRLTWRAAQWPRRMRTMWCRVLVWGADCGSDLGAGAWGRWCVNTERPGSIHV